MAAKSGIEIIEEGSGSKKKAEKGRECPVCGAPNGLLKCDKCGWGIEEDMEPLFGTDADPVTTLRDARMSFVSIKKEAMQMKEKNRLLLENNRRFADLVEIMGNLIAKLRVDAGKRYSYSFNEGGWGESGKDGKSAIKLAKHVTVEDINKQLMEITHLINKYKK
jgi:hypothetical protein